MPFTTTAKGRPDCGMVVTPWIAAYCAFGNDWLTSRYRIGLSRVTVAPGVTVLG